MARENLKVLAIDPGYDRIGIAVIKKTAKGPEELIFSECFETSRKSPHEIRLRNLAEETQKCIEKFLPDVFATEKLYFSKNVKTAMAVAEARGAILEKAASHGLPIFEFSPQQIKLAVTGYGASDKQQVMGMVKKLIKLGKDIKYDDEYDAIAIGLTWFASNRQFK